MLKRKVPPCYGTCQEAMLSGWGAAGHTLISANREEDESRLVKFGLLLESDTRVSVPGNRLNSRRRVHGRAELEMKAQFVLFDTLTFLK